MSGCRGDEVSIYSLKKGSNLETLQQSLGAVDPHILLVWAREAVVLDCVISNQKPIERTTIC